MGRKTLTDAAIKALKPKGERYSVADPLLPNHYLRVTPNGAKTFAVKTRDPRGKQVLATIGPASLLTVEQAREKAREAISAIKAGQDIPVRRASRRSQSNGSSGTSMRRDYAPREPAAI